MVTLGLESLGLGGAAFGAAFGAELGPGETTALDKGKALD
jgi:hypothetical protein